MNIKRINALFFKSLTFRGYNTAVYELFNGALETAYKTLFNKTDFHKISAAEIAHINQLLKTSAEIINSKIPDDEPNINDITLFLYLSKAIQTFYKEQSAGKNFLENQRTAEDKTASHLGRMFYNGKVYIARKLYLGDLFWDRNDWIPKRTKTYLRGAFFETYGAYPEQLYAALIFYLVKTFYSNLHGPTKVQIQQILRLITKETTIRQSQKASGALSHSKTDYEKLYEDVRNEFQHGELFIYCKSWQSAYYMLRSDYRLGDKVAREYMKRLKNEFPDSPTFKNKSKKDEISALLRKYFDIG